MTRLEFKVGQRFGRLVILGEKERRGTGMYWKCKCDCGKKNEFILHSYTDEKLKVVDVYYLILQKKNKKNYVEQEIDYGQDDENIIDLHVFINE